MFPFDSCEYGITEYNEFKYYMNMIDTDEQVPHYIENAV